MEFLRRLTVEQFTDDDLIEASEGESEGESGLYYQFDQEITGIVVINDSASPLTVSVNDMAFIVAENEKFEEFFEPFNKVYFSGDSLSFRAWGRK